MLLHAHPQIAAELAAAPSCPKSCGSRAPARGIRELRDLARARASAEWVAQAKRPLPPGLPASPTLLNGAFSEIFATLASNASQRALPPSEKTYFARPLSHQAGLEALLRDIEVWLARGKPPTTCPLPDTDPACSPLPVQARSGNRSAHRSGIPTSLSARSVRAPCQPASCASCGQPARRGPASTLRRTSAALWRPSRRAAVTNLCKDTSNLYVKAWHALPA
jgi:hypothetical protein